MKVHLEPTGQYSTAMVRIAAALRQHLPSGYTEVRDRKDADLCVMYVIGLDAVPFASQLLRDGKRYAVVQCCLRLDAGTTYTFREWAPLWKGAAVVWSYYNLFNQANEFGFRFFHSPLGVDDIFLSSICDDTILLYDRAPSVLTMGYVSGPGAEPIEEVWAAASHLHIPVTHVGPRQVHGIGRTYHNVTFTQPNDRTLMEHYARVRWVAALRHVEGFELPAAEGLVCGARPIVFDQPAMREWYNSFPIYVPDLSGTELISVLVDTFNNRYVPVEQHERLKARARFSWPNICGSFWSQIQLSCRDGLGVPPQPTDMSYGRRRPKRNPLSARTVDAIDGVVDGELV